MLAFPGIIRCVTITLASLVLGSWDLVSGLTVKRSTVNQTSGILPETAGVEPIPCHSHNDYLRNRPLIDALENGCISVEADIWQRDDMKDDLRVGHTKHSLKDGRTLREMYVTPIIERLQGVNKARLYSQPLDAPWNGIFLNNKSQSLVLLIDFKTGGDATWSTLIAALEPLRDGAWLSYWDIQQSHFQPGAITVVASGKATLDQVTSTTFTNGSIIRRDVFLDAPLANLGTNGEYNTMNSFYASTDYAKSSNNVTVKDQIAAANNMNLKSRYWNAPDHRSSFLQTLLWRELLEDNVAIFNTDHLTTFRKWWESLRAPS